LQQVNKKQIAYITTLSALAIALVVIAYTFFDSLSYPWTRDGQVKAQVVLVTPRISGPIIELYIDDNQEVKKGHLLFKIDPRTFETKVDEAAASLDKAKASAAEAKAENERIQGIYQRDPAAVSNRKVTSTKNAFIASKAAVKVAEADLQAAKLDLEFTEVRAPVDGYVTNLNLQIGTQAVANQPALALVDINSFWVHGFFKETQIKNIQPGNHAVIKLMTYPDLPLKGYVHSIGWGIAQQDGSTGVDLLPNVNPSFDWIRLAQRIPVKVHLVEVPEKVKLRIGMTASVNINTRKSNKVIQKTEHKL